MIIMKRGKNMRLEELKNKMIKKYTNEINEINIKLKEEDLTKQMKDKYAKKILWQKATVFFLLLNVCVEPFVSLSRSESFDVLFFVG